MDQIRTFHFLLLDFPCRALFVRGGTLSEYFMQLLSGLWASAAPLGREVSDAVTGRDRALEEKARAYGAAGY